MSVKKLNVDLDFQENQALNMSLQALTGNPVGAIEGRIWYNATTKQAFVRTDTADIPLGGVATSSPTLAAKIVHVPLFTASLASNNQDTNDAFVVYDWDVALLSAIAPFTYSNGLFTATREVTVLLDSLIRVTNATANDRASFLVSLERLISDGSVTRTVSFTSAYIRDDNNFDEGAAGGSSQFYLQEGDSIRVSSIRLTSQDAGDDNPADQNLSTINITEVIVSLEEAFGSPALAPSFTNSGAPFNVNDFADLQFNGFRLAVFNGSADTHNWEAFLEAKPYATIDNLPNTVTLQSEQLAPNVYNHLIKGVAPLGAFSGLTINIPANSVSPASATISNPTIYYEEV